MSDVCLHCAYEVDIVCYFVNQFFLWISLFITMPAACSSDSCFNGRGDDPSLSFHQFPLDDQLLLEKWLQNLDRTDFTPTRNHLLCSSHFTLDCFLFTSGRKRLKRSAIPTLFGHTVAKKQKEDQQVSKNKMEKICLT